MKIAVTYPKNIYACWYALGGYREALTRMGHQVLDLPVPGNIVQDIERLRTVFPSVQELSGQDLILSCYHEYMQPWLHELYGFEKWQEVMKLTPVIARYDESMDRSDLGLPERLPELKKWAHYHSFPAQQDAEKYDGQWLPFSSDTTIFKPEYEGEFAVRMLNKKYPVGFIGSMYPIRTDYYGRLLQHLPGPPDKAFQLGAVIVQDVGGVRELDSTKLLAENYRQFKIFFCLPPMSRLIVEKVFDVMACGTFVMYPKLPWGCNKNMQLFRDGKEIVYYDPGFVPKNAKQILYWLEHEEEREKIAEAGLNKIRAEFRLEQMLDRLLTLGCSPLVHSKPIVVQFPKEPSHVPAD
jgi:hypothetical protein